MCDSLQQQSHLGSESRGPRSSVRVVGATWLGETQGSSSEGKFGYQQPALDNAVEKYRARIQTPLTNKQIWSRPRHLPLCDSGTAAVGQLSSAVAPFPRLCSACSDGGDVSSVTQNLIHSNIIVSDQVESWMSYSITYIKFLAEMILMYTAIQVFGSMPSIAGL
jgi:hypothetical protein